MHKKSYYGDLLGYIGYAIKKGRFSMFVDIGMGTVFPNPNMNKNSTNNNLIPLFGKDLLFDVNFGIGFSI
jgi:hypothetical protein